MASFTTQTISSFLTRNLTLITVSGSIVAFWMMVYTFAVYKPSYAAKSTVIIKDSALTRRFVEPEQYYATQTTTSSSSNPVLNTMGILKSSAISHSVYLYFQNHHPEQLKKYKIRTQEDWESFFGDGTAFVKAKNQAGTDLISIQFSWSNPRIAKEALETVVKAFQNASRDLNKEEQVSRTHFMGKQVGEIESQLLAIRQQKSAYQSSMQTVNVRQEGENLANTRVDLANKVNQLEAQARGKQEQVEEYQRTLGMNAKQALRASAIGQNRTIIQLQDELYRLQQVYSQLLANPASTPASIEEVRAQIIQTHANIRSEESRTLGKRKKGEGTGALADNAHNELISKMVQAQTEADDLKAQAKVLRSRLSQVNGQIQEYPHLAESLTTIEQKEASLSLALDQLRQKVLEGRLKEEQTLSNVFIVDAPRMPEQAQFPSRSHLLMLSLVLGACSGLGIALLKEQLGASESNASASAWLEAIEDDNDDEEPNFEELLKQKQRITRFQMADAPDRRDAQANATLFDSLVPVAGSFTEHHAPINPMSNPITASKPSAPLVNAEVVSD